VNAPFNITYVNEACGEDVHLYRAISQESPEQMAA